MRRVVLRRGVLRRGVPLVAACALLAGCTTAVAGLGSVGVRPATSLPTEPSAPNQPAPATVDCPHVTDPAAGIAFRCVTAGLTRSVQPIFTLTLTKPVEADWVLAEGAAALPVPSTVTPHQVASVVREQLIALNSWGPDPGVRTLTDKAATVAGRPAWVLASEFTIANSFRAQNHLTVRTERTWIVAIRISQTRMALWYVTLPDQVSTLWKTVPSLITSITLT